MCDTEIHPVIPDSLIDALEEVLARHWSAELFDFREADPATASQQSPHFFTHLEVIREWLDYLEEDCGRGMV